ncbi:unnamed protein product, partial [Scytosiphon promiscuus]
RDRDHKRPGGGGGFALAGCTRHATSAAAALSASDPADHELLLTPIRSHSLWSARCRRPCCGKGLDRSGGPHDLTSPLRPRQRGTGDSASSLLAGRCFLGTGPHFGGCASTDHLRWSGSAHVGQPGACV